MKRMNFTLLELIVVCAILASLAAAVLPRFVGVGEKADVAKDANTVGTLIKQFQLHDLTKKPIPSGFDSLISRQALNDLANLSQTRSQATNALVWVDLNASPIFSGAHVTHFKNADGVAGISAGDTFFYDQKPDDDTVAITAADAAILNLTAVVSPAGAINIASPTNSFLYPKLDDALRYNGHLAADFLDFVHIGGKLYHANSTINMYDHNANAVLTVKKSTEGEAPRAMAAMPSYSQGGQNILAGTGNGQGLGGALVGASSTGAAYGVAVTLGTYYTLGVDPAASPNAVHPTVKKIYEKYGLDLGSGKNDSTAKEGDIVFVFGLGNRSKFIGANAGIQDAPTSASVNGAETYDNYLILYRYNYNKETDKITQTFLGVLNPKGETLDTLLTQYNGM